MDIYYYMERFFPKIKDNEDGEKDNIKRVRNSKNCNNAIILMNETINKNEIAIGTMINLGLITGIKNCAKPVDKMSHKKEIKLFFDCQLNVERCNEVCPMENMGG